LGGDDEADGDADGKAKVFGNGKSNGKIGNGVSVRNANGNSLSGSSSDDDSIMSKNSHETAFDVSKLKLRNSKVHGKKGVNPLEAQKPSSKEDVGKKKQTKKNRVWGDAPPPSKLDFTEPRDEAGQEGPDVVPIVTDQGLSLMDKDEEDDGDFEVDFEEDSAKERGDGEKKVPTKKGWFSSLVQSVAGKAALEKADLEPALKVLKDRLMTKNVAADIAEKLCDSVAASLLGKKQGSFTRISSTVQAAMEEALLRILTPKRSVDILRDVHQAKEQGRPYVIVFVGVNGVGKSTNLAKVAYWLVQHDVSVMMAACDTFRSGAVEQLRTHARRLQIPIFEKGYEKDPAMVAKEAIREAVRTQQDVVLVDTAGRMQDNEPLMRALSKLINLNEPDLVLFVGEALVGNDGVDQLTKFNQKLVDLSTTGSPRLIDGILLTKFDTIDDKVGAALSMVYVSGVPVMFVGCGQTYTDLKKLNVKSIVKSLLV
jgi:signal recognition particle receptor subunit alpha